MLSDLELMDIKRRLGVIEEMISNLESRLFNEGSVKEFVFSVEDESTSLSYV